MNKKTPPIEACKEIIHCVSAENCLFHRIELPEDTAHTNSCLYNQCCCNCNVNCSEEPAIVLFMKKKLYKNVMRGTRNENKEDH